MWSVLLNVLMLIILLKLFSSIVFIMVIRLNKYDTSYVIFLVLKYLLSSNGSLTRTHLITVFFRNETGTDFIFFFNF